VTNEGHRVAVLSIFDIVLVNMLLGTGNAAMWDIGLSVDGNDCRFGDG